MQDAWPKSKGYIIDYYNNLFNTNFLYKDFRRNLITKDIELNDLIDKKLSIGSSTLLVHDLCSINYFSYPNHFIPFS